MNKLHITSKQNQTNLGAIYASRKVLQETNNQKQKRSPRNIYTLENKLILNELQHITHHTFTRQFTLMKKPKFQLPENNTRLKKLQMHKSFYNVISITISKWIRDPISLYIVTKLCIEVRTWFICAISNSVIFVFSQGI